MFVAVEAVSAAGSLVSGRPAYSPAWIFGGGAAT